MIYRPHVARDLASIFIPAQAKAIEDTKIVAEDEDTAAHGLLAALGITMEPETYPEDEGGTYDHERYLMERESANDRMEDL